MSTDTPKSYRSLDVWQRSMELVESVYSLSNSLSASERFGLISQSQRAAVSIPSAEGYGRGGKDYRRFVMISRGSPMELETQLELAVRIGFLNREAVRSTWKLAQDVGKMLNRLAASS